MEELKKVTTSQNRIDLLHASSIDTLEDIIYHYPYKYDEVTEIWPPVEDKCCVGSLTVVSNFSLTKSLKTLIISMLLSYFIVKFVKINVLIRANMFYNRHRR